MSQKRIAVVAGASGFVGAEIVRAFEADGYEVRRIGRTGTVTWGDPDAVRRAVDGADVLVNMAGKPVNCRYTDRNRDEMLHSRVETSRMLRDAVAVAAPPPRVWLNASTATIYRHETERPNTEQDGILGSGFSVDVAREWEREFFAGDLPDTRRVALRMAIVLGDGPATNMLVTLARVGLGGPQHDGWWFRIVGTAASDPLPAAMGARRSIAPAVRSGSAGCTSTTSSARSGSSATATTSPVP